MYGRWVSSRRGEASSPITAPVQIQLRPVLPASFFPQRSNHPSSYSLGLPRELFQRRIRFQFHRSQRRRLHASLQRPDEHLNSDGGGCERHDRGREISSIDPKLSFI